MCENSFFHVFRIGVSNCLDNNCNKASCCSVIERIRRLKTRTNSLISSWTELDIPWYRQWRRNGEAERNSSSSSWTTDAEILIHRIFTYCTQDVALYLLSVYKCHLYNYIYMEVQEWGLGECAKWGWEVELDGEPPSLPPTMHLIHHL